MGRQHGRNEAAVRKQARAWNLAGMEDNRAHTVLERDLACREGVPSDRNVRWSEEEFGASDCVDAAVEWD